MMSTKNKKANRVLYTIYLRNQMYQWKFIDGLVNLKIVSYYNATLTL